MCVVRIMHRIPLVQAVVDEELQHLAKRLVVLWLLKERCVGGIMKNDEGSH